MKYHHIISMRARLFFIFTRGQFFSLLSERGREKDKHPCERQTSLGASWSRLDQHVPWPRTEPAPLWWWVNTPTENRPGREGKILIYHVYDTVICIQTDYFSLFRVNDLIGRRYIPDVWNFIHTHLFSAFGKYWIGQSVHLGFFHKIALLVLSSL